MQIICFNIRSLSPYMKLTGISFSKVLINFNIILNYISDHRIMF